MNEFLNSEGIEELYPPQKEAMPHVVAGKNLLLAIPTASGKSLVAYLAIAEHLAQGGKAVYLCPLRALAAEKYEDLRGLENDGYRVKLAVGDYDRLPPLDEIDVLVATSEKADSVLRLRPHWVDYLTLVIVDECHLLHDPNRGPTLEVLLTRMRHLKSNLQFIALSATVGNPDEMASWLDAEVVLSEWRPVRLKAGIYSEDVIYWPEINGRLDLPGKGKPVHKLVVDIVEQGHQALVFVNSRKHAQSVARDLAPLLIPGERAGKLSELGQALLGGEKSQIGEALGRTVPQGAAFHHAGLDSRQRSLVEAGFREGLIKAIVATPTLAAGVNLPARRVVIRDIRRWGDHGWEPISRMEIHQMMGRAGRPRYDDEGEAIVIAHRDSLRDRIMDEYIFAPPEEVLSRLGAPGVLRTHVLASFASGVVTTEVELLRFFGRTLFAHQHDLYVLDELLSRVVEDLKGWSFIDVREDETVAATDLGRMVSRLYVDPRSAHLIVSSLRNLEDWEEEGNAIQDFDLLLVISTCPDIMTFSAGSKENYIMRVADATWWPGADDRDTQAIVKTAVVLEAWMNEFSVAEVEKQFNVSPGDLYGRQDVANWLVHAMQQIGRIIGYSPEIIAQTALRLRYGARKELLQLVALPGVGRVRARNLYAAGLVSVSEIATAKVADISRIAGFGSRLAASVIEAASGRPVSAKTLAVTRPQGPGKGGGSAPIKPDVKKKSSAAKQTALFDF